VGKLVHHVNGITFYRKGKLPPVPDAVHRLTIEKREGGEGTRLWVDDLAGLLGLGEIGAVELTHGTRASMIFSIPICSSSILIRARASPGSS
jgi:DNA primase